MNYFASVEHKGTKYIFEPPVPCNEESVDSLAMLSARALVGTDDYTYDISGATADIDSLFNAIDDDNPDYLAYVITSLLHGNGVGYRVTFIND